MFKLRSISKIDFDNYIKQHKETSHFMQSSAWGEFEKVTNHVTPHYLGLINNEKIIAATLLLEEHLPMNNCSLYAPRGFILDYKNKKILYTFINKLKDFAKIKKAISIKINPAITYKIYRQNKEILISDSEEIISNLKKLGFKRKEKIKLLEYTYTIDLTKDLIEIENNYSKKIREKILSTAEYDIELTIGTHKDFEELFSFENPKKNNYYETLYDILSNNEHTKIKLFLGKLHITKTQKKLEKELKRINNQISIIPIDNLDKSSKERLTNLKEQKVKITNKINKFKNYKLEYGNYLTISTNLMIEQNNKVWILFEKNNHILEETNLKYTIYNEYIKYYKDKNFHLFNQQSPFEQTNGFNELKKEFGGEFTEYIGEYELITNKFMYFIHTKILSIFNKSRKEDVNEISNSN